MTLSELRQKDVINLQDGQLLGKAADLEFCEENGQITALVVPCAFSMRGFIRGERTGLVIPWEQIEKIGNDVVLVRVDTACC